MVFGFLLKIIIGYFVFIWLLGLINNEVASDGFLCVCVCELLFTCFGST